MSNEPSPTFEDPMTVRLAASQYDALMFALGVAQAEMTHRQEAEAARGQKAIEGLWKERAFNVERLSHIVYNAYQDWLDSKGQRP